MASKQEVKQYLAHWLQLGKKVLVNNGEVALLPQEIIKGDRYSEEFEEIWRKVISPEAGDCSLEGTQETIAELLTPVWEMNACARCSLPVPVRSIGMPPELCPCHDLSSWPNAELPPPRNPVDNKEQLTAIRDRLLQNDMKSL